jgi:hypothetical protein
MSEDKIIEICELFYYFDSNGKKLYTSNEVFAHVRSKEFGTNKVFIEKNTTN